MNGSDSLKSKVSWVNEILESFCALGGAARYDDLYEYIERTTSRELTTEWRATVRRTIEDHSSDSENFRSKDLFRRLGRGFWGLRQAANLEALVEQRDNRSAKAVVDEVLAQPTGGMRQVFVREHWRRWPEFGGLGTDHVALDRSTMEIVDAWVGDRFLEVTLVSGLAIKAPLNWYVPLLEADRTARNQFQVGEYGLFWPHLGLEILLNDMLRAEPVRHKRSEAAQ